VTTPNFPPYWGLIRRTPDRRFGCVKAKVVARAAGWLCRSNALTVAQRVGGGEATAARTCRAAVDKAAAKPTGALVVSLSVRASVDRHFTDRCRMAWRASSSVVNKDGKAVGLASHRYALRDAKKGFEGRAARSQLGLQPQPSAPPASPILLARYPNGEQLRGVHYVGVVCWSALYAGLSGAAYFTDVELLVCV
jgi:hypothetical protein